MTLTSAPSDDRQPVRFGLLGYGFMGRAHANALRTIPYIFWPSKARPELFAVSGRTEASVREAATRYGFGSWTTDWRDLVTDEHVDVFDNVGPDAEHVEPTLAAIEHGKHVVCEKPLAMSASDAQRLYEAATAAGVKHMTCFNYRFFPAVRLALQFDLEIAAGEVVQRLLCVADDVAFGLAHEFPQQAVLAEPGVQLAVPIGSRLGDDDLGEKEFERRRLAVQSLDFALGCIASFLRRERRHRGLDHGRLGLRDRTSGKTREFLQHRLAPRLPLDLRLRIAVQCGEVPSDAARFESGKLR